MDRDNHCLVIVVTIALCCWCRGVFGGHRYIMIDYIPLFQFNATLILMLILIAYFSLTPLCINSILHCLQCPVLFLPHCVTTIDLEYLQSLHTHRNALHSIPFTRF